MREYLFWDWAFAVALVSVLLVCIFCQFLMIYHILNLIKEREKSSPSKKGNSAIKSRQSGVAIPCKKVAIPAFYVL